MLRPAKPSRAGSSVSDATMVTSTASDAVKAKPFSAGWPTSRMPSIETTTVRPGEHHGATGRRDRGQGRVSRVLPSARLLRYRVTMSSA